MKKAIVKLLSSGREYIGSINPGMTQEEIDDAKANGKTYHTRPSDGLFYGQVVKDGKPWGRLFSFFVDQLEVIKYL